MKTIKFYYFLLLTTVMMQGCSKYDDTELRGRVLEEWQKKASVVSVGFDKYDTFYGSTLNNEIMLILPSTFKETDYSTIVAKVTNESGTGMDIQTRSAATESIWGVKVAKPTFDNGVFVAGSAKISITPPANIKLSQNTMLEVTITDKDGKLFSIARPIKFFDGQIAECIAGSLSSIVTNSEVTKLAVKGSVDATDFAFIRSLKALEVLDLSLTDITSIGDAALSFENSPNTTLKQIIIPESVTTIGGNAFRNCQALESFDLVNTENLGGRAFQDCTKLRSIKLGNKLTAINNLTYYNCVSLTSIDIPSNVTTLGRWIFENCENLETITLHDGLQNLSISTFYSCGIVSILIPSTVTEIPDWAFEQCEKLERISLHNAIKRIGSGVFSECKSLKTIKIPTGVTVISELAFRYCMNLQTVTLHEGITEIQKEAFFSCENLPLINFNLLTSLKTLGERAFQSCTSLRIFDISKTSVEVIPDNLLNNCTKLEYISVSKNLKSIGEWVFSYCPFISIDLPASLTTIGDYAFWECKSLINVFCRSVEGPQFSEHTFNIKTKEGRLLYIPKDSKDKYADLSAYFERIVYLQ